MIVTHSTNWYMVPGTLLIFGILLVLFGGYLSYRSQHAFGVSVGVRHREQHLAVALVILGGLIVLAAGVSLLVPL